MAQLVSATAMTRTPRNFRNGGAPDEPLRTEIATNLIALYRPRAHPALLSPFSVVLSSREHCIRQVERHIQGVRNAVHDYFKERSV